MRRYGRSNVFAYIIFGLMAVGVLSSLIRNAGQWVVPIVIFGLVFLLYRYPPSTWRYRLNRFRVSAFSVRSGKNGRKRKRAKFRVIRGNKPDDDNVPKYH